MYSFYGSDLPLRTRYFCSTSLLFTDRAFTYQGKLFHLSKFLRQSVYLLGVLVYFSQTNYHLVGTIKFYLFTLSDVMPNMK